MENKANYALIGAFVLIAVAALLGFILWLTGAQFDQEFDIYQVEFNGPVRGLSAGSEVRFNGIGVGSVTAIRLDRDDPNTVLADIRIDANTPVDTKSEAVLEPLGLTGLNYLQITSGGEQYPRLSDLPGRDTPRIQGKGDTIAGLLEGGGSAVEQAQIVLTKVTAVLSEENIESVSGILTNIERITRELDVSEFDMENVNGLISDLRITTREFGQLGRDLQATAGTANTIMETDVKQLFASLEGTLDEVEGTLNAFEGTATGADDMIVDARDAINRLSNSGLTDLEETVDGIRTLVLTLGRVADALEQSPLAFISGQESDIVELPQ